MADSHKAESHNAESHNAESHNAESHDDMLPMPWGRFRLILWVWHVLYLGGLASMLALAVLQDGRERPGEVAIVAGCVLAQTLLYFSLIMRSQEWPLRPWKALLYFGGSAALWIVQWGLDPRFLWVGWALVGQMFGTLQPAYAVPAATLVAFYFYARINQWDIARISGAEVVGWLSMMILYLYIYGLNRASIDRSRLVRELREAQSALLAARADDLELAALRERERLARDLHDGLGHTLAALSVQLEAIQRLYRVDPARASAQVDASKELVRGSMEELRRSLAGLRAPGLAGGQTLDAALAPLCAAFQERSGIVAHCRVVGDAATLPPAVADVLWRVIQETLTNVQKHAKAAQVEILLEVTPQAVTLAVTDDGIGLSTGSKAGGAGSHLGLLGMAERVEGVGGALEVASRTPHGVTVNVRIPLRGLLAAPPLTELRHHSTAQAGQPARPAQTGR